MSTPYGQQPPPPPPPPPRGEHGKPAAEENLPKRSVSTGQILGALLFIVVLVFVLENTRTVTVRLLVPEVKAPLAVVIIIAAVLGALIAWLLRYRRNRNHPTRQATRK